MKLTKKNFKKFVPKEEQSLISGLIDGLKDVNKYSDKKMYIDWQDYHDEYSPERVDPCPDYYGYYTLRFEGMEEETVGTVMTPNELDSAICILFSYNYLLNIGSEINDSFVV